MPVDRELKQLAVTLSKKIPADQNGPYRIRTRKPGAKGSRGQANNVSTQYNFRTIKNMRTQPLSDADFNRLPEGLRDRTWRFVEVVPKIPGELPVSQKDEMLEFGDEFEYKGHWYEIKFINDWDLIQGCKAVFVE